MPIFIWNVFVRLRWHVCNVGFTYGLPSLSRLLFTFLLSCLPLLVLMLFDFYLLNKTKQKRRIHFSSGRHFLKCVHCAIFIFIPLQIINRVCFFSLSSFRCFCVYLFVVFSFWTGRITWKSCIQTEMQYI